ncbi:MAG: alkaline phosphatase PhoX [Woeseia sp.]
MQALAVAGQPAFDTRNWDVGDRMPQNQPLATGWIDLEDVDSDANDLRHRGRAKGAAVFARGEGICYANGEIVMTCTIGGPDRLGQIFAWRPDATDAGAGHSRGRGHLRLIAESKPDSLLRNADNIVLSPWGDLVICEDTARHCGVLGMRPDGQQYPIADNAWTKSELAGITFSPDGSILFLNIQNEGLTLAISGPWPKS